MTNIKTNTFSGGAKISTPADAESLTQALRDVADDIELLRSKFAAALAKLDADAGVTDTNYVSLHTVLAGSIKTKKV
jgi:hypothetical protein